MSFLKWFRRPFASFAINPVMNDDHAQHFRELNELLIAVDRLRVNTNQLESQDNQVILMLRHIIDEMTEHFRREQELMGCYGYAGKDSHQSEHNIMIKDLELHYSDFISGVRHIDKGFVNMMKEWMITHMKRQDRRLNAFLSTARPVGKLGKIASSQ